MICRSKNYLQIEELFADQRTIFNQRNIFADGRAIFDLQIEELSVDRRTIEADRRTIFN